MAKDDFRISCRILRSAAAIGFGAIAEARGGGAHVRRHGSIRCQLVQAENKRGGIVVRTRAETDFLAQHHAHGAAGTRARPADIAGALRLPRFGYFLA